MTKRIPHAVYMLNQFIVEYSLCQQLIASTGLVWCGRDGVAIMFVKDDGR